MALDLTWVSNGGQSVGTTELSLISGDTTLQTSTAAGYFTLALDPSNMAQGDEYLVTLYEKATSGGTKRVVTTWTLLGNQGRLHIAPGFPLGLGWDWTIQKLAGTDRSFSWTIRRTS